MKPNDIVKYNEKLGKLIKGSGKETKGKLLFQPPKIGMHYERDLDVVTEYQLSETTIAEKVVFLREDFTWGRIINEEIINDGEYIILSYLDKRNGKTLYHTYLNFDDTNRSYYSLDSALIGLLDYKYQGTNSQAAIYIERMLEMNKKT